MSGATSKCENNSISFLLNVFYIPGCSQPFTAWLHFIVYQLHMGFKVLPWVLRDFQVALVVVVKNLSASAGDLRDMGLILGSGRSPGGGHGNPLQYSCLENPMDRGPWLAMVLGVTKSQTRLKRLSTHVHGC